MSMASKATLVVYDPQPVDLVATSYIESDIESDIVTLRKKLSEAKEDVALLHVLPFHSQHLQAPSLLCHCHHH